MLRLKPSSDGDDKGAADGYNGNARYYLQQAKRVHTSVKPTDDKEMVMKFFAFYFSLLICPILRINLFPTLFSLNDELSKVLNKVASNRVIKREQDFWEYGNKIFGNLFRAEILNCVNGLSNLARS